MTTIYKYPLPVTDRIAVDMPAGSEILTAQMQAMTPCLWAKVDTSNPIETRYFRIFGTGHPMPSDMGVDLAYVATMQDRSLVWHLFEDKGV